MADVGALNQDFRRYDQVAKAHTYRLAESDGDAFDDDYKIATLDFAPFLHGDAADKASFAAEFTAALEEIGFAVLVNHGVDPALYDEMDAATHELFTSVPLEEKPIGGLGVHLIRQFMDELAYAREAGKNVLRMGKRLGAAAP